jgi:hypothetical protein
MYFRLVFTITNAVITAPRLGFKSAKLLFPYGHCLVTMIVASAVSIILTDAFFPIHTHLHYRLVLLQSSI